MRTVRLGRAFDAVFIYDAVMYMSSGRELRAALATVAGHLEPGGVALVVPDATAETGGSHRSVLNTGQAMLGHLPLEEREAIAYQGVGIAHHVAP